MNKISALIVDDNEVDRYLLTRHLNDIDVVDIFEADDGSSALEFLSDYDKNREMHNGKFPPIVIFLDINMPILNGFEFLDEFDVLRKRLELKACVIMMYSSSERQEDKDKAAKFDFVQDFLIKGEVTPELLRDKVSAL